MSLAYVICSKCKARMVFGEEVWHNNKPVCVDCKTKIREGRVKEVVERVVKPAEKKITPKVSMEIDPDELEL